MARKISYLIIVIFLISLICAACAEQPAPQTPQATKTDTTDKPQYGGVLRIIGAGGIVSLGVPSEPYSGQELHYMAPVIETLVHVDETGIPVPWLATEWKWGSDYKSITFTLRKGVKYHDGTDFNAKAAKYCLDLYKASPKTELKGVTSIDIIDDYTIRLNLKEYDGALLYSMAIHPGRMISPTAIETKGKEWCLMNPVGTGPFKFVNYQRDVSLKLTKFDGYWQKGKPYLDGIEWTIIAEPTTALLSFRRHESDVVLDLDPKSARDLKAEGNDIPINKRLASGLIGDSAHSNSPYADIRVRRAVEYAIDKKAIVDATGFGFYEACNQPAQANSWYYNPKIVGYPYNPQKAKELLADTGYPNGFKTKIIYQQVPSAGSGDFYVAIQGYLSKVGIDATVEPAATAKYTQICSGGWENALLYCAVPIDSNQQPGQSQRWRFAKDGGRFNSIIHPDGFEAQLVKANAEPDLQKSKALYQELSRLLIDEYCLYNPIYVNWQLTVKVPKVHSNVGAKPHNQWDPEDSWLSK